MKVLFDNGAPRAIARRLVGHEVAMARALGWHELVNGDLIAAAEASGFDILLTTDKNIRYQQNLANRKIALVVLGNQQWPRVRVFLHRVVSAVDAAEPGSYCEVDIPFRR